MRRPYNDNDYKHPEDCRGAACRAPTQPANIENFATSCDAPPMMLKQTHLLHATSLKIISYGKIILARQIKISYKDLHPKGDEYESKGSGSTLAKVVLGEDACRR